MQVNLPGVHAELLAAFERYERALVENDLQTLDALFWHSARVVRYGVADIEYGIDAIRAFRSGNPAAVAGRELSRTVITTFGNDFGTANTEFSGPGNATLGRQSQTWVRIGGGWCIVSAHVSVIRSAGIERQRARR